MKIYLFSTGFETMAPEGAMTMVLNMKDLTERDVIKLFQDNLKHKPEFSGTYWLPIYAVGAHVSDIWISCVENPKSPNDKYFNLAKQYDPSFKALGFVEL